jgi:FMN phosphatase YigB (HAD superfamily)
VEKEEVAFVGDDPEADVAGALGAGLQPVWTTYVRDNNITPAPGVVGKGETDPDPRVPRISNWEDLLALLEIQ